MPVKTPIKMNKYIAFLRGINVSGHHKVPMLQLRKEMEFLNFTKVSTLLNSGNIIFESNISNEEYLEKLISNHLEKTFGFPIPTIIRKSETILQLIQDNPFENIAITKKIRLYISLLKNEVETDIQFPWSNDDQSFKIINKIDKSILSVLDLSINKTPKGMDIIEKTFGKNITTRNWNTIKRIEKKLKETR